MSPAADDKALYSDTFYSSEWAKPIQSAAKALYGRLNFYKEDSIAWGDLDVDTFDHYCIAARHAVRAFMSEAEK